MENWEAGGEVAAEERLSFEDSDRFDEESICSWMSESESQCTNWRGWKRQSNSSVPARGNDISSDLVPSLMELCSKAVASHIPFEQVEKMYPPVPENVQLQIAYWSFPADEEDIRLYSCLANGSSDEFQRGEHFVRGKCVGNVLQIGFHLSGTVNPLSCTVNKTQCCVAVTFDRRKITSCSCNCALNAKWCAHVVALCLLRIQQPTSVCFRAPVSESLSRLRRDQLQKFAQYLISELPQQILPTAQRLLDELLSSHSTEINTLSGAPDPTAGPSMLDKSLWYLDESALRDNIKKALVKFCGPTPVVYSDISSLCFSSVESPAAAEYSSLLRPLRGREPEGIWNLFSIVREMLKRNDSNAFLLLEIITEQCLCFEQVAVWWYNIRTSPSHLQSGTSGHGNSHRPSNNVSSEIAHHAAASLCDEIVALWRLIILDPTEGALIRKNELKSRLMHFHDKTLQIIKRGKYKEAQLVLFSGFRPAIEACSYDWASVDISSCSHLVQKANLAIPSVIRKSEVQQNANTNDTKITENVKAIDGNLLLPMKPQQTGSGVIKKTTSTQPESLPSNRDDPDSGSDDSCIEQDIQGLQIGVDNDSKWRDAASSSSDFTLDEKQLPGSFVKAPSSSGGNQSPSSAASQINPVELEVLKLTNYRNEMDALFTRAESLYAHGKSSETSELAVKLAEEVLGSPEELISEPTFLEGGSKAWIALSTSYACKLLERALFLCTVLSEHQRHCTLAFRIGLQGLSIKRLPASNKRLEVKLFYLQSELAALMKKLPLGSREVTILRKEAHWLAMADSSQDFCHVLPLILATFIFDAFCQPTSFSGRGGLKSRDVSLTDQELGFEAAVNALSCKVNVSEYEHPLLCEGTRRQKGELAIQLLVLYKDQQFKLRAILDNLLDKSMSPNLRATSAFPETSASFRRASLFGSPLSSGCSQMSSASDQQILLASQVQSAVNAHGSTDDDTNAGNNRSLSSDTSNALRESDIAPTSSISCDEDPSSSSKTTSFPRQESKASYRPPSVRPKRKQHSLVNMNSSASEEAMLSDSSPPFQRRNLNARGSFPGIQQPLPSCGSAWPLHRYPSSPSSDSGSSGNDSVGTSSVDNKRNIVDTGRSSQAARLPLRPGKPALSMAVSLHRNGLTFRKTRGRNSIAVPDIPNQPSEAGAHFFFELAKNVFVKAGGNSSTSLFMQQPQGNGQTGVHRNLVLAAFEIGLYALGLHNCVSPNWLSRTYSSHVSWITGQAMEIGSAALHILVDSWDGHLTPPETVTLADRASRGRDSTTVRRAAELALSVLPRAHALNPSEIQRALLQCKEQGVPMLEKACYAVEQAGRGGGVYPEVLFDVARQWEWMHRKANESGDKDPVKRVGVPEVSSPAPPFPGPVPASGSLVSVSQPTTAHSMSSPSIPASVGTIMLPAGMLTIQDPRLPMQCHTTPVFHGFSPALLDQQLRGHQMTGVTPGMQQMHQYAAVQLNPVPGINLVPMPASNLHTLQYHPTHGTFVPDPHLVTLHPHQNGPPPLPVIPTMAMPVAPLSVQLLNSFRVGMLALDLLTKRTEDRPNNKYTSNPPYASNVKWILNLSMKLGVQYVQQFCLAAIGGISSPYVLQDIAVDSAKFLSKQNKQPVCTNLRTSFVLPIMTKCIQMYINFIYNRLYHLHHPSDHEEFVGLVHTTRAAYGLTPGGVLQFNDVLQSIRRSKACTKELWQKLNSGVHI